MVSSSVTSAMLFISSNSNKYTHIKMCRRRKLSQLSSILIGGLAICSIWANQLLAQQVSDYSPVESQLAAALAQLGGSGAGQPAEVQLNQISALEQAASQSSSGPATKSRPARSIGEMFKKFFNGNKRNKTAATTTSQSSPGLSAAASSVSAASVAPPSSAVAAAAAAAAAARDWEQQQQAIQVQQFQQSQAANMAAVQMAAAAANQHAVYASPFASYTPPASTASAIYPQFAASAYSPQNLVAAWPPNSPGASFGRGQPGSLLGPSAASSGPLYAAASQSYNSYVAPPTAASGSAHQASSSAGSNPQAAASHAHPAVAPAPSSGAAPNSALDFHQVLDAFVRTSGFAPAGDQEAAAAQGYAGKGADGAVPVFSFKKLVSLPFYLSTEDKSLDSLANAMPQAAASSPGYLLHSIPIMRRHVRRMSATPNQQQQQQQAEQRSERAQQMYNNFANSINSQLASMSANSQVMQMLQQQQQADSINSASVNEAIANYQSLKAARPMSALANLAAASSVLSPSAVSPPASLSLLPVPSSMQQQQRQSIVDQQQQQQQEIQNLLDGYQSQLAMGLGADTYSPNRLLSSSSGFVPSQAIGERYGSSPIQQQVAQRFSYPPAGGQFEPSSSTANLIPSVAQRSTLSADNQQTINKSSTLDNQSIDLDQNLNGSPQQASAMMTSNSQPQHQHQHQQQQQQQNHQQQQQQQSSGPSQAISSNASQSNNGATGFAQNSDNQQQ